MEKHGNRLVWSQTYGSNWFQVPLKPLGFKLTVLEELGDLLYSSLASSNVTDPQRLGDIVMRQQLQPRASKSGPNRLQSLEDEAILGRH